MGLLAETSPYPSEIAMRLSTGGDRWDRGQASRKEVVAAQLLIK